MIVQEKIFNKDIYIDEANSNFSVNKQELIFHNSPTFSDMYNLQFGKYQTSSVVFCINLSNACNLKCDYCFNVNKNGKSISIEIIKQYLDLCFKTFPNKEKYHVDLSGKGEPLLFLKQILEIKEYCEEYSNKLKRES